MESRYKKWEYRSCLEQREKNEGIEACGVTLMGSTVWKIILGTMRNSKKDIDVKKCIWTDEKIWRLRLKILYNIQEKKKLFAKEYSYRKWGN